MSIQPGQSLLHYNLVDKLGEGGMGVVYEAEDTRLNRHVALKVLAPELSGNRTQLQRFQREAQAVAALSHPNIVTIFSVEQDADVHFITMELVRGQTLDRVIPEDGFGLDRLFEVSLPLADAVSAAHECGITHRDLKPGNVMLGDDGRVRVLDFGLAKLEERAALETERTRTAALTGEGAIVGTVPYMSPEQVEGKPLDHRTDIFSLGAMLYEMATGKRPFHGDSSAALVSAILRESPSPVSQVRDGLPRHLGRVVRRCLEKNPRDRYQTARDVYNELRTLKREIAEDSSPSLTPPSSEVSSPTTKPSSVSAVSSPDASAMPWIAVLPFTSSSSDTEIDAVADGLGEDVATGLSQFPFLFVIAHKSTQRYKGAGGGYPNGRRRIGRALHCRGRHS